MKVFVGLVVLALAVAVSALAPLQALPPRGEYIPNEYIVILTQGLSVEARDSHIKDLQNDFALSQGDNQVLHTYHIDDFVGFHAKLSQDMLARERAHPEVRYIDYNQIARASETCSSQNGATWGLDRINQVEIKLDGHYNYGADGSGVDAYVIDTGIRTTHQDFGGRASWGKDFVDANGTPNYEQDCNGHGTHVASTVGGTTWGVAKGVHLIAVKVLGCGGGGTWDGVISGIEYVANNGKATMIATGKRSVANMSLGGGLMPSVNEAVEKAVAAGVVFAIAAGNSNADACRFSPASAPSAITVGATTIGDKPASLADPDEEDKQEDRRSYFSNYGKCLDIFAPGELITGAWIDDDTATETISGTSMASPHVAGAAAVLLSADPTLTPAAVADALNNVSTKDVVANPGAASPNRLLYTHCAE